MDGSRPGATARGGRDRASLHELTVDDAHDDLLAVSSESTKYRGGAASSAMKLSSLEALFGEEGEGKWRGVSGA